MRKFLFGYLVLVLLSLAAALSSVFAQHSPQYNLTSIAPTDYGYKGSLSLISGSGPYGDDIFVLDLIVDFYTKDRLRIKLTDARRKRWEVPADVVLSPEALQKRRRRISEAVLYYDLKFERFPFSMNITRKSDGYVMFDSRGLDFVYSDYYLTIATRLQSTYPLLYGWGERVHNFRLDPNNKVYSIWNRDYGGMPRDKNLYGTQPFLLEVEQDKEGKRTGNAHGLLLMNSNAMQAHIDGPGRTLRLTTIGGVLDLYFFMGPSPSDVVKQLQGLIGKPALPPYWSLGFHYCRYGYKSIQETWDVVKQYRQHNLPLETMWSDLDYMDEARMFTFDPVNYPLDQVYAMAADLKAHNYHYVMIVDPGIKVEPGYAPYDDAIKRGGQTVVLTSEGKPAEAPLWSGTSVFPDFSSYDGLQYWYDWISRLMKQVELSGLWIDMNEPATFTRTSDCPYKQVAGKQKNNADNLECPPFLPVADDLGIATLPMTSRMAVAQMYNSHSLYGHFESIATRKVLQKIHPGKRPFVLTRASFLGTGKHATHWLGDNDSSFYSMTDSISGVLNMNMFGIPFVGPDVCGHFSNTTAELCGRWMQLATVYPFSRNHNAKGNRPYEPYTFNDQVTYMSGDALTLRLSLLPYLYTLLWDASQEAEQVWRPFIFEFPTDPEPSLPQIDRYFMFGKSLLVVPVLEQGASKVNGYFPVPSDQFGPWFDFYSGKVVTSRSKWLTLDVPFGAPLPLFMQGGTIIPRHGGRAMTTVEARQQPYEVVAALNDLGNAGLAHGKLVVDDGESDPADKYTLVQFVSVNNKTGGGIFIADVYENSYIIESPLEKLTVYGLVFFNQLDMCTVKINTVMLSNKQWIYDKSVGKLTVSMHGMQVSLNKQIRIEWFACK